MSKHSHKELGFDKSSTCAIWHTAERTRSPLEALRFVVRVARHQLHDRIDSPTTYWLALRPTDKRGRSSPACSVFDDEREHPEKDQRFKKWLAEIEHAFAPTP